MTALKIDVTAHTRILTKGYYSRVQVRRLPSGRVDCSGDSEPELAGKLPGLYGGLARCRYGSCTAQ